MADEKTQLNIFHAGLPKQCLLTQVESVWHVMLFLELAPSLLWYYHVHLLRSSSLKDILTKESSHELKVNYCTVITTPKDSSTVLHAALPKSTEINCLTCTVDCCWSLSIVYYPFELSFTECFKNTHNCTQKCFKSLWLYTFQPWYSTWRGDVSFQFLFLRY